MADAEHIQLDEGYWLPYQERLILDAHPHVLRRKSRRCGMTYALSFKRVRERIVQCEKRLPPRDAWFTSQDLDTAREYVRDCAKWLKVYKAVAVKLDEEWLEVKGQAPVKTYYAEFPNGARITALSSNPKALHGRGGDVDIDEHAWHRDGGAVYDEAGPCIRWGGGQMTVFSNPSVQGTSFDALCADARAELARPAAERFWSYEEISIFDAVREGLVEKIRGLKRRATEAERRAFVEECRGECRTEEAWLRNYCCTSASAAAAYLPLGLVNACETDQATLALPADSPALGPVYIGIDLGRTHDLTVVWAAERVGEVLWTREVLVMRGVPFHEQFDRIVSLAARLRFARMAVDAGGIGMQMAEDLARRFGEGRVDQVHLAMSVQEDLAARMWSRFESRTIRIPPGREIREDLVGVHRVDLPGGGIRLETIRTEGGHADRFWALALCVRAALSIGECGPVREEACGSVPALASLVGAARSEGGFRW